MRRDGPCLAVFLASSIIAIPPLKQAIRVGYDFTFYSLVAAVAGLDSWKRLPHFLWSILVASLAPWGGTTLTRWSGLADPWDAASLALGSALFGITALGSFLYLRSETQVSSPLSLGIASLWLCFASPAYVFLPWDRHWYLGYIGIAVYHNPTLLLVRPFALVSFIWCKRLLLAPHYPRLGAALGSAFWTSLSIFAKPSWAMAWAGGFLLLGGWDTLRQFFFSTIRDSLKASPRHWTWAFLCVFVPLMALLFWRTRPRPEYYSIGQFEGVAWAPGTLVELFSPTWWVGLTKIVLSIALPLSIGFTIPKHSLQEGDLSLAWCVFLAGLALTLTCVEKGQRLEHGNFAWCAVCALFILCLESFRVWLGESQKSRNPLARLLPWSILFAQALSGVGYWFHVVNTGLIQ